MKATVLLMSLLSTACVPVVQHGPWVRPGYSGSVGGTFVAVHEGGESGYVSPLISFEGGMRWGFAADSANDGVSLGFNIPLIALLAIADLENTDGLDFFRYINLDGFIATPVSSTLNASFGITGSYFHTMPYVQLGKYDRWYTTQAVMLTTESDAWLYAPSFTWVNPGRGGTRTHLTATAALGSDDNDVYWMAGFSIIFEFARARN